MRLFCDTVNRIYWFSQFLDNMNFIQSVDVKRKGREYRTDGYLIRIFDACTLIHYIWLSFHVQLHKWSLKWKTSKGRVEFIMNHKKPVQYYVHEFNLFKFKPPCVELSFEISFRTFRQLMHLIITLITFIYITVCSSQEVWTFKFW